MIHIRTVGIDRIAFHVPHHYVDMVELANARNVDPNKYLIGIGQEKMAVPTIEEDIVAMGANAALRILTDEDRETIDQVIFATESGIDFSKSAATYVHQLLGIQKFAKSFEIKHACYGGTAGLLSACDYVRLHPDRKVLVITSDIARYGLNSGGEPTQGAGAIAMVVSADPRVLAIDSETISMTDNQFDFWRPNYAEVPFVEGKYSTELYISMFNEVVEEYAKQHPERIESLEAMTFHLPFTKMGRKSLVALQEDRESAISDELVDRWLSHYDESTLLGRQVGNVYTGSLYLSLISLLNFDDSLKAGQRIGLFSYGSGAVAELFTAELQEDFKQELASEKSLAILNSRQELNIADYEEIFNNILPTDGGVIKVLDKNNEAVAGFYLDTIDEHRRIYGQR